MIILSLCFGNHQTFPQQLHHLTPAVDVSQLLHIPPEVSCLAGWAVVWLESGHGQLGSESRPGGLGAPPSSRLASSP